MNREVEKQIGSLVRIVEEVDINANGVRWGKYFKVKVELDRLNPPSKRKDATN